MAKDSFVHSSSSIAAACPICRIEAEREDRARTRVGQAVAPVATRGGKPVAVSERLLELAYENALRALGKK